MNASEREWVIQRWYNHGYSHALSLDDLIGNNGEIRGEWLGGQWMTFMEHNVSSCNKSISMRERSLERAVVLLRRIVIRYPSYEYRLLNLSTLETIYPEALGL